MNKDEKKSFLQTDFEKLFIRYFTDLCMYSKFLIDALWTGQETKGICKRFLQLSLEISSHLYPIIGENNSNFLQLSLDNTIRSMGEFFRIYVNSFKIMDADNLCLTQVTEWDKHSKILIHHFYSLSFRHRLDEKEINLKYKKLIQSWIDLIKAKSRQDYDLEYQIYTDLYNQSLDLAEMIFKHL